MARDDDDDDEDTLYDILKNQRHDYDVHKVAKLLETVNEQRVVALSESIGDYIATNLPKSIDRRNGLPDYRTNPYVLLTSASIMKLGDAQRLADFLFNNKLYAG